MGHRSPATMSSGWLMLWIGSKSATGHQRRRDGRYHGNDMLQPRRGSLNGCWVQARRAAEDAARRLALEDELKNVEDPRQVEIDVLSSKLSTLGMAIKEIRPDGHCLYHAVADQLERIGETVAGPRHATLRQRASSYMLENADAFLPFMLTDEGALLSEKEFETHCAAIVDTNDVVWGGQPELSALAATFQCRIIVYSSDADPIVMGDADDGRTLRVSFHRHYLMGHHYNSVVPNDVQQ